MNNRIVLQSQPIIGTMKLAGETMPLHKFTSFVPTPDTEAQIDEIPLLAGQGVGLIHEVMSVAQIIDDQDHPGVEPAFS